MEDHKEYLEWHVISKHQKLSEQFIEDYAVPKGLMTAREAREKLASLHQQKYELSASSTFSELIQNYDNIGEVAFGNFLEAWKLKPEDVSSIFKQQADGSYKANLPKLAQFARDHMSEVDELALKSVEETLTKAIDDGMTSIPSASDYVTKGTTIYSDMTAFVKQFNEALPGAQATIQDLFGYDKDAQGYVLDPQKYRDYLAGQKQMLQAMGESTEYIDFSKPFYAYYMTISGHAQYNWGGNSMAARHKELMTGLPYSDKTKAYLACEYEVELMLKQMLEDLNDAGILDKTVIVLTADHIPYNDMDICDDIAGHELEKEFEQYENALIIWSGAMKEPVVVDKYCSSIDILPTVLNLFGIEFDSRLMAGRDILSDSPQLVMFNGSKSFISDKCMYNAKDGSISPFAPYTGEDISKEYILSIQEEIKNKARLASLIIDNNYYDKLSLPLVLIDVLEGSNGEAGEDNDKE